MEKKRTRDIRFWVLVWGLGLVGQLCWNIENQWFNTFVYAKIAKDPTIISWMVAISAIATTIATFLFGTLSDRVKHNFGMCQPEGYRKALRLMKEAEKFHRHRVHPLGHLHNSVRHDGMDHRRPACEFRPGSDACGDGCCLCRRADVLLRLHGQ